jgi:hypothetical protein
MRVMGVAAPGGVRLRVGEGEARQGKAQGLKRRPANFLRLWLAAGYSDCNVGILLGYGACVCF